MKIPTKFCLNNKDYKIYFDNEKKTHVCEDLETGEKTNVGVLGTFLQMGILKTIDNDSAIPDDRLNYLMEKVLSLEEKLTEVSGDIITEKPKKVKIQEIQEDQIKREPVLKKHPKSDDEEPTINQRIVEKIIEKTIEEENKEPSKDVNIESNDEIDNWMEI